MKFQLHTACLLLVSTLAAHADVKLPSIFGDNMVLQQNLVAPIWGKADPGEKVTISVAGQSVSTVADEAGKWKVNLQPMKVDNTPLTMSVTGKNSITLKNILIGEVWLGSGQSNMTWGLIGSRDGAKEVAAANYPTIRLFTVEIADWKEPLDEVKGQWMECTPETAKNFSSTLYFFGRDLQKEIKQPIGLIHSSVGGTIIQLWTRLEVLKEDPETKIQVENQLKNWDNPEWQKKNYEEKVAKLQAEAEKAIAEGRQPNSTNLPPKIDYHYRPAARWNAMIHPLLGFPIRGVVWYQGEFNVGSPEQYERLFPMMIQDWRAQWGQGEFPFLFVQLPNHGMEIQTLPPIVNKRGWAGLREVQLKSLKVPNTGMAVTIDTSDGDLHPKDKQPVGNRLARLAAHMVYKKDIPCYSPIFEKMTIEGSAIRLKFKHVDGGLIAKENQPLKGFALAGTDKKFVWGEAKIEGDCVVVSSPQVPEPVAVRYGWDENPLLSLYNKAGLPASPFRTDDWK